MSDESNIALQQTISVKVEITVPSIVVEQTIFLTLIKLITPTERIGGPWYRIPGTCLDVYDSIFNDAFTNTFL